jgi:hypothetical protein
VAGSLPSGIPGLGLAPGDHVCAFYLGLEARDEVLLPYLAAGLEAGDKCICVLDAPDPSEVLARLGPGLDVEAYLASHQLEVRDSTDAYLRSGRFSVEETLAFWHEAVGTAVEGGRYRFARSAGELTWALGGLPDVVDELVRYEAELNRFASLYPQVILCLYDLERFGGGIVVDMLKTHPRVLLGGMVLENPHYLSPDEFLASRT